MIDGEGGREDFEELRSTEELSRVSSSSDFLETIFSGFFLFLLFIYLDLSPVFTFLRNKQVYHYFIHETKGNLNMYFVVCCMAYRWNKPIISANIIPLCVQEVDSNKMYVWGKRYLYGCSLQPFFFF